MKDLLIYTYAVGRYRIYADLFQFSIQCSYPEYDSHVFTENIVTPTYYGACIRFLTAPYDYICDYRYFYITDIDMMIAREPVSILEYHSKEMESSGLCYSNSPRGTEEQGPNRLTGLHFCNYNWFMETYPARMKYTELLNQGKIGNVAIDDELMLMNIVKESGLQIAEPRTTLIERHHGLHLGTIRSHKKETIQALRRSVFIRVSPEKAIKWQEIVSKREYIKILEKIKKQDRMAYEELVLMDKFTKQRAKD